MIPKHSDCIALQLFKLRCNLTRTKSMIFHVDSETLAIAFTRLARNMSQRLDRMEQRVGRAAREWRS